MIVDNNSNSNISISKTGKMDNEVKDNMWLTPSMLKRKQLYQDINDAFRKMKEEDPFSFNEDCFKELAERFNLCKITVMKALKMGGLIGQRRAVRTDVKHDAAVGG